MPVALISTSTSPAFGPCSCTVSMVRGAPALWATAARTSMVHSSRIRRESERCVNYGTAAAACATSLQNSTGIGTVRQLWNMERLPQRVQRVYIRRAKASSLSAGGSCCPVQTKLCLVWTLKGGTDDASQSYEAQEDFACSGGRSRSGERFCRARGDRFEGRRLGPFVLGQRQRLCNLEQLRYFGHPSPRGACLQQRRRRRQGAGDRIRAAAERARIRRQDQPVGPRHRCDLRLLPGDYQLRHR